MFHFRGCEKETAQGCDIYSSYISSGGYSNAKGLLPHITFVTGDEEKLDGVSPALVKKTPLFQHHPHLQNKQTNESNATSEQSKGCLSKLDKFLDDFNISNRFLLPLKKHNPTPPSSLFFP